MLVARFRPTPILIGMYLASVAYGILMGRLAGEAGVNIYVLLQRQLPGQFAYFVAGSMGYYFFDVLQRYWGRILPFALAGLFVPWPHGIELLVRPAALGAIVLYLALGLRFFGNFGRYGDMSYGIYIFHFPIVQTLVSFGVFRRDPWLALGIASGLVLLAAFLSWHLIEKPFLRRSSHYVQATRTALGG